ILRCECFHINLVSGNRLPDAFDLVTNPLSVISGGKTTEFLTDPYLAAVCEGLFKEANAVEEVYGFEGCQFSEFERLGRSM
ncbi:hypothetical protein ACC792_37700, partial [Rhizobium ruizarguesonis]